MTHRVFSRNAGSSRARPSARIIEQVRSEPWGPIHWGANQAGMQAHKELDDLQKGRAKKEWWLAAQNAAEAAEGLVHIGAHKQIVNRVLEPFTYIDVLVSGTDFNNWYALRDHEDAQPEIRELAQFMHAAEQESTPKLLKPGEWHLPYINPRDWQQAEQFCQQNRITRDMPSYGEILDVVRKISVARCARVSYKAFDGNVAPIEEDIELFNQLMVNQPLHASPAEHQATPDYEIDVNVNGHGVIGWAHQHQHGNFRGWRQFRKMLPNEFVPG